MDLIQDRNRLISENTKNNQSTDDLDSLSSISPLSQRQRARSKRNSIRSELKLTLIGSPQINPIKQKSELFKQKYELLNKIGEGGNAVVKKCRQINDKNNKYVVKIMRFQDLEQVLTQQSEYIIGNSLNHPNIVKVKDFIIEKTNQKTYIVQEYAQGDSLIKYRIKNKSVSEIQAKIIMEQVFQAVKYMHKKDICHRDLHSGNIIFDSKTQKVKIIDFSISKQMKKEKIQLLTQTGIVYYMAPEQLDGSFYGKNVDSWTLGVVLYVLLFGDYPFTNKEDNEDQVIKAIIKQEVKFPEHNFSNELIDLIKQLLDKDIKTRISIDKALNHPWFSVNKIQFTKEKLKLINYPVKPNFTFKKQKQCQQLNLKKGLSLFSKQINQVDITNQPSVGNSDCETNDEYNTESSLLSQFQNPKIFQHLQKKSAKHQSNNNLKTNTQETQENQENSSDDDEVNELGQYYNYTMHLDSHKISPIKYSSQQKQQQQNYNNNQNTIQESPDNLKNQSSSYNDNVFDKMDNSSPRNLYNQSNSGNKIYSKQHYTSFGSQNKL